MSGTGGRLSGLTALVTGAGRGIGAAIARRFAAEGATLVLNARTASDIEAVRNEIHAAAGQAACIAADIGTAEGVNTVLTACGDRVDILVHNAGIFPFAPIESVTDETWHQVMDVNLTSAMRLTRGLAPFMRTRGFGRLLFTSSVTGNRVAVAGVAHYAASKAGLNGFIRTAALEFATAGITVNGVEPGLIETPGANTVTTKEERTAMARFVPMKHWGRPEDIAAAMLFLAGRDAGYITGQTLVVDGGAMLPENAALMI